MGIHQVVVAAVPGDAVTSAALAFRELLRRAGRSDLYARYVDPRLAGDVRDLGELEAKAHGADLLVYHASIGDPHVASFLLDQPQRLVLVYHNITPPEYFAGIDPAFASLLTAGRSQLLALRRRVLKALAVSPFNARELEALGYRDVDVSPLPVDLAAVAALEPDPATARRLREEVGGPIVLFVGQLLPHKRPDLLLQAHHVLSTYLLPEAHLVLVGPSPMEGYRRALERLVEELALDAHITGWVRQEELVAFYRAASCFVTMSEHEGLCVPLLEAMTFGVPVVARAYAAIPETVAGAGVVLPADADASLAAEAAYEVISNETLREALVADGRRRAAAFDVDAAHAAFLSHLVELV